jgi:hypothetical protein
MVEYLVLLMFDVMVEQEAGLMIVHLVGLMVV